jgi:hypothetical protein
MFVKNFNVFCLLMSCLFLFLQQIWGVTPRGMGRSWFTLLLNNVAVLSVLALPVSIATRLIQIQASVTIRTVVGLIEGFLIGMLLPQFFPKQVDSTSWFLCLVLIVLCQLVSIFVLFTIWPSSHSSEWLPKVYAAIWALAPILYFAEEFHTISSFEVRNSYPIILYAVINTLMAFLLKLRTSAMTLLLKTKTFTTTAYSDSVTRRRLHLLKQQEQEKVTKTKIDFEWVPTVGNISTVAAVILWTMVIPSYFSRASEIPVALMMLSLLMLLHPQKRNYLMVLPATDKSPFLPIVVVVSLYLVTVTLVSTFFAQSDMLLVDLLAIRPVGTITWSQKFVEVILLCAVLPSIYVIIKSKSTSRLLWLSIAPLNLFSLVLTQFNSVRLLALIGLVGTAAQYIIHTRKRRQSLRQI